MNKMSPVSYFKVAYRAFMFYIVTQLAYGTIPLVLRTAVSGRLGELT